MIYTKLKVLTLDLEIGWIDSKIVKLNCLTLFMALNTHVVFKQRIQRNIDIDYKYRLGLSCIFQFYFKKRNRQVPPPNGAEDGVFRRAGSMLSVCVNICSGDELLSLAPSRLYLCHKTPLQNHPTAMHQPPQFPATFKTHPESLFKCIEMKEKAFGL